MVVQHRKADGTDYSAVAPAPTVPITNGASNGTFTSLKPAAVGDTWTIYLTGDFTENYYIYRRFYQL